MCSALPLWICLFTSRVFFLLSLSRFLWKSHVVCASGVLLPSTRAGRFVFGSVVFDILLPFAYLLLKICNVRISFEWFEIIETLTSDCVITSFCVLLFGERCLCLFELRRSLWILIIWVFASKKTQNIISTTNVSAADCIKSDLLHESDSNHNIVEPFFFGTKQLLRWSETDFKIMCAFLCFQTAEFYLTNNSLYVRIQFLSSHCRLIISIVCICLIRMVDRILHWHGNCRQNYSIYYHYKRISVQMALHLKFDLFEISLDFGKKSQSTREKVCKLWKEQLNLFALNVLCICWYK